MVIKKIRKERGITGAELAKKICISQQQISRYERGVNKLTIDMLLGIAEALGVSLEVLLKRILLELQKNNLENKKLLKLGGNKSDSIYFY